MAVGKKYKTYRDVLKARKPYTYSKNSTSFYYPISDTEEWQFDYNEKEPILINNFGLDTLIDKKLTFKVPDWVKDDPFYQKLEQKQKFNNKINKILK